MNRTVGPLFLDQQVWARFAITPQRNHCHVLSKNEACYSGLGLLVAARRGAPYEGTAGFQATSSAQRTSLDFVDVIALISATRISIG